MESILPIILIARFQIDQQALKVHYSVENRSTAEVYLVNRLTRYEAEKGWIPEPKLAYVFFEKGGEVEVTKRVPPMPQRLVTPRDYYVTPLPPGEKLEEELSFPLPLKEHRPYDSFAGELPPAMKIEAKVEFVIGYFPAHRLLKAEPVEVHGVETFRLVRDPDPAPKPADPETPPAEVLLRSTAWTARLPVIPLPKP